MRFHCELTLTFNRFTLMQRSLYNFLNQDYEGNALLLIFNTGEKFELGHFDIPPNKEVILINDQSDFPSIGDKYMKAIEYIPSYIQTVNIKDDDDSTTTDHITQGIKGLLKGGNKAYKPQKSYFYHQGILTLQENTFEGSIFMKVEHLRDHKVLRGYSVKYHDGWLLPLIQEDQIFVDPDGIPTFLYDWHNPAHLNTYKMSGRLESQENYDLSKLHAKDYGTGILNPSSQYLIKI